MGQNEIVFESVRHSSELFVWVLTILILLCVGALAFYIFKPNSSVESKLKTPLKFIVIASILVAIGFISNMWSNNAHMDNIILSDTGISTPFGYCDYRNIKHTEFKVREGDNSEDGKDTFFLIEEYSGTTHVIRGSLFDIESINSALDSIRTHLQ